MLFDTVLNLQETKNLHFFYPLPLVLLSHFQFWIAESKDLKHKKLVLAAATEHVICGCPILKES